MTLRILHCHSTFARGGKELRAVRIMNALGSLARHSVVSAMPGELDARAALDPDIAVAFPRDAPSLTGRPGVARYRALAAFMQPFDLVLTYNWGALDAVMARRIFVRSLPPLVHHEDGFNEDESRRLKTERTLFRRLAFPAASALVVPSQALHDTALAEWRQPRGRVQLIRNGVDLAHRSRSQTIPGLKRKRGDFVIGTVAGLRAVKNIPMLVRAAATIPNAVLVIIGDGPERHAIDAQVKRLGMTDRVVLPGFLADPPAYLAQIDLFALASNSEQAPIALMEAMAAGLPAVATLVGDVASMVSPENRPFVVPAGDERAFARAMLQLAGDGTLRRAIGDANRNKAAIEFDERQMIDAYFDVYARALGRRDGITF